MYSSVYGFIEIYELLLFRSVKLNNKGICFKYRNLRSNYVIKKIVNNSGIGG